MQNLTIILAVVAMFVSLFHYLVRCGRKARLIDKIPGPYAWPLIGNTCILLVPPKKLWKVLRELNANYYPIFRFWGVIFPLVNLQHPDDVEALLSNVKHIEKSLLYDLIHPWLNTGLLTSSGSKWQERRKMLTPAFHFNVLRQFTTTFIEQSDKLVASLCLEGDEIVEDLVALLHKYTLNSICETAMGFKSSVDGEVFKNYRKSVSKIGDIMLYRVPRPLLYINWLFKLSSKYKEQERILKVLHGFSTNIIEERKQYHKDTGGQFLNGLDFDGNSNNYSYNEEEHLRGKRRLAMLDLLISASQRGANIDDQGIREEVDTFIFEGHDTTAMGLCFTLMLLAENKEIQAKARAEVDGVFGGRGGQLTLKEIQSLTYVERCIKESLRLFPSVPFISRNVSEDLQLTTLWFANLAVYDNFAYIYHSEIQPFLFDIRLENYLVPAGTVVDVFVWDLHRNANFWPNPDVFDPDRFLPENAQGRHPFAYIPFSAGPRNCIGQKFAMLEMKSLVGNLLYNFYLEPIDLSSDVEFIPDLILRPTNPIRMKIIRRTHDD